MSTIPMPEYPDHQPRPEHVGQHSVPFAHTCTNECTPGTCEVQHDLEFGGPELRATEKFERDTARMAATVAEVVQSDLAKLVSWDRGELP